jgi:endonuclease YncB( thermonuclease family)
MNADLERGPFHHLWALERWKPRVVDGDTIHIGKTKIRLHGIAAPEMKQTCRTSKGKEQKCGVFI